MCQVICNSLLFYMFHYVHYIGLSQVYLFGFQVFIFSADRIEVVGNDPSMLPFFWFLQFYHFWINSMSHFCPVFWWAICSSWSPRFLRRQRLCQKSHILFMSGVLIKAKSVHSCSKILVYLYFPQPYFWSQNHTFINPKSKSVANFIWIFEIGLFCFYSFCSLWRSFWPKNAFWYFPRVFYIFAIWCPGSNMSDWIRSDTKTDDFTRDFCICRPFSYGTWISRWFLTALTYPSLRSRPHSFLHSAPAP